MKIKQKHFDALLKNTKCKFWNNDSKNFITDYLLGIAVNSSWSFSTERNCFFNCEPLKPENRFQKWFKRRRI